MGMIFKKVKLKNGMERKRKSPGKCLSLVYCPKSRKRLSMAIQR